MPDFLVSYDLTKTNPDPYTEFKKNAVAEEWYDWALANPDNSVKDLPNTTLVRTAVNINAAVSSFKNVIRMTQKSLPNMRVSKVTIVEYTQIRAYQEGDSF